MNRTEIKSDFAPQISLLMNTVVTGYLRTATQMVAPLGVNITSARVLIHLLDAPTFHCNVLAKHCGLDVSTLSHMLRALEKQQLIARQRSKTNARIVEVRLTNKGRNLAIRCHKICLDGERIMLEGLAQEDIKRVAFLLTQMTNNMVQPQVPKRQLDQISDLAAA